MFRINRRADYGVRVVLALARRPYGVQLPTHIVQEEMQIPRAFLQQIVAKLSRAAILVTTPGPKGGLQLARAAADINLRDVIEALEGPVIVSECLCGPAVCPLGPGCPVRSRWGGLQAMILGELERTTMAVLAADSPLPIPRDLNLDISVQNTIPALNPE